MTGLIVTVLLGLASTVLVTRVSERSNAVTARQGPPGHGGTPGGRSVVGGRSPGTTRWRGRHDAARIELHELPLFVHQLAGLLRAGRPPHALWTDMQRIHSEATSPFSAAALPILGAAGRAANLGLSVPDAMRQATTADGGQRGAGRRVGAHREVERMWVDLAGCLEVAERSGAPLAAILEQYAGQLDAHLDGVAARETALAGPRATVVLLAWLPVVGLGLGFALGINPLVLLTSSLLGRLALAAGLMLMVAARLWSRALIRAAGGSAS